MLFTLKTKLIASKNAFPFVRHNLARLQLLHDEGRLLTAGPMPAVDSNDPGAAGFTGSTVIAEFESLEAAQAWADADPYVAAGVYEHVSVKPFKKVF
ncbi:TPA: YciI family protein [Escherichia coli]|nr:YciI family protein [Escherichia coli]HDJ0040125.1 YciI family protein [Escherichia coli]HDJ0176702.1 YciI family protein [Escherichia coli]HDJ0570496.1 YciI family protein [Escherichia coli]